MNADDLLDDTAQEFYSLVDVSKKYRMNPYQLLSYAIQGKIRLYANLNRTTRKTPIYVTTNEQLSLMHIEKSVEGLEFLPLEKADFERIFTIGSVKKHTFESGYLKSNNGIYRKKLPSDLYVVPPPSRAELLINKHPDHTLANLAIRSFGHLVIKKGKTFYIRDLIITKEQMEYLVEHLTKQPPDFINEWKELEIAPKLLKLQLAVERFLRNKEVVVSGEYIQGFLRNNHIVSFASRLAKDGAAIIAVDNRAEVYKDSKKFEALKKVFQKSWLNIDLNKKSALPPSGDIAEKLMEYGYSVSLSISAETISLPKGIKRPRQTEEQKMAQIAQNMKKRQHIDR